jgi:hypothetical protein
VTAADITSTQSRAISFSSSHVSGGTGGTSGTVTAEADVSGNRYRELAKLANMSSFSIPNCPNLYGSTSPTIQFRLEWQLLPVVPQVTPVAFSVARLASELKRADSGEVRWA